MVRAQAEILFGWLQIKPSGSGDENGFFKMNVTGSSLGPALQNAVMQLVMQHLSRAAP